mgnify:FL=1
MQSSFLKDMEFTPPRSLDGGGSLRKIPRSSTAGPGIFPEMDSEVVPLSLAAIAPILRVANEIEAEHPRVAYLCKFLGILIMTLCNSHMYIELRF